MPTYRCETCGTTQTSTVETLDQFWIAPPPPPGAQGSEAALRYCGSGCLPTSVAASAPPTPLGGTLQPLSQWFDSHASSHRVIALLSPT